MTLAMTPMPAMCLGPDGGECCMGDPPCPHPQPTRQITLRHAVIDRQCCRGQHWPTALSKGGEGVSYPVPLWLALGGD